MKIYFKYFSLMIFGLFLGNCSSDGAMCHATKGSMDICIDYSMTGLSGKDYDKVKTSCENGDGYMSNDSCTGFTHSCTSSVISDGSGLAGIGASYDLYISDNGNNAVSLTYPLYQMLCNVSTGTWK